MEKVINVLYEIEERANRILDRTSEQKAQLYQQLNKDLEKLERDINAETNQKLAVMKKNMESEIIAEREQLMADCTKQLQRMEESYEMTKKDFVDKVFTRIISTTSESV